MGNQKAKPTHFDAANMNINSAPTTSSYPGWNDQNLDQLIQDSFRRASINGKITKDRFNEALVCLEKFGARLRDTPLGARLLNIFDQDKSNSVDEREFFEGLSSLLHNVEKRYEFSFKAFDKDGDNRISRREFVEFFEETWMSAFRILGERCESKYGVSMIKFEKWAQMNQPKLVTFVDSIYKKLDRMNSGFIDYQSFKEWAKTTDISSITATYMDEKIELPLTLVKMNV
eukprot:TRINITY_DN1970_c0_g1_i1.p1 TRINITY_DN1970_c0_g1~~TRINITY_DN1970_c0_g1_i1.p1  ORF type:complete len:230 (-),score=58.48 TRINITY_DN1970_c0_g1_i1:234-923(-)